MKVVVSTPTGNIGRVLTDRLLDGGAEVVLMVRNPDKVQDFVSRGATALQGDLGDADFVSEATRGADCLFWLTPPDFAAPDHRAHQLALGRNAAAAVRANAIPRVVHLSSVGAQHESGTGPIAGLHHTEKALNEVAENVTHLRPTMFMENILENLETIKAQKSLFLAIPGDVKTTWIATRDIGEFAAERILDESWTGRSEIELSGPDELSHAEVANILTEELGEAIGFVEVTPDQTREALIGMGMSESVAKDLVEIYTSVASGLVKAEQPRITATSFRDFTRKVIVPLAKGTIPAS